jgi:type IV pilus assembly protein PilQ
LKAQAFKGANGATGSTTRVIISLLKQASYRIRTDGNALRVSLAPAATTAPAEGSPPPASAAAPAQEGASASQESLRDVRFSRKDGADRIVLDLSGPARFTQGASSSGRSRLELRGVKVGKALERTLDVGAFGGLVRAVSTYRAPGDGSVVIVEVDRAEDAVGTLSRAGNSLIWSFSKGSAQPGVQPGAQAQAARPNGVAVDGGVARRVRTVAREEALAELPRIEGGFSGEEGAPGEAAAFVSGPLGQQRGQNTARRFTGTRVDIDLKDADIHNVLRILADVGKVNIVTADNVKGEVSLRLRNVPWDQALDVVLQSKGLGMVRTGNMLRVAPLAELEKEREMQIARRKQELELAPVETRLIPVSYAEAGHVQGRAKELLSARGSIAVDDRTNVLIVRDVAGNLNQVEELIRSLDTQTPQVLIEARIVEATSRYLRDVGIQWGGDATFSPATGNPTGLAFPARAALVGGGSDANTPTAGLSPFTRTVPNPNFAVNLPAAVGTGQGGALGLSFGSLDNAINLGLRLSAAESSGMLRIVSSPRILTLDNKEARIAQGTLIPFSQVSAQGVQTNFQEAKLQLLVKPHVTADGSIAMHVKINRDEPDFNQTSARGDPTILKREAETDLLIMDGHTAVIGGIFTRNTGRNLDQIPFFGDIPLLGVLFQRRRASDSRGELVIFLTPRIVNRAEALGK